MSARDGHHWDGGASAPKLLVLGIDGGTWEVIEPLLARGQLPHLASLVARGAHGSLRSTLPPQSAPAWVSLVTGKNPGRHGVFDFWRRDLRSYGSPPAALTQSQAFAGQTLWDYAGHAGSRVGIVSVPVTYPAWPVNGFMISGTLLAPGVGLKGAYPPSLAERYGVSLNFPDAYRYGASRESVMREGPAMMVRRRDVVLDLLNEYPCDLLVVVLGETDKAQHDFWRYREGDCTPQDRNRFGGVVDEHYRAADGVLGHILDAVGEDGLTAVVSDHGAGPYPRRSFRTNAWLRGRGLLELRGRGRAGQLARQAAQVGWRHLPEGIRARVRASGRGAVRRAGHNWYSGVSDIDWSRTSAYRIPMETPAEGIAINLEGRQPDGIVADADYASVVDGIITGLDALVDPQTGDKVVAEVYRRDEAYSGPHVHLQAPDVVMVLSPPYRAGWGAGQPVISPVSSAESARHRGAHAMEGIFVLSGPGVIPAHQIDGMSILDVMPTLLYAMDLAVPDDLDGRVRRDVFAHSPARPVRRTGPLPLLAGATPDLSEGERQEIASRLGGLGYLD